MRSLSALELLRAAIELNVRDTDSSIEAPLPGKVTWRLFVSLGAKCAEVTWHPRFGETFNCALVDGGKSDFMPVYGIEEAATLVEELLTKW